MWDKLNNKKHFKGETEPEAIFKACEWILEQEKDCLDCVFISYHNPGNHGGNIYMCNNNLSQYYKKDVDGNIAKTCVFYSNK